MEQLSERQLLRNIGCKDIQKYLVPMLDRQKLQYPKECCQQLIAENYSNDFQQSCIGLDCEMIQTNIGSQICRVTIASIKEQIIFDSWFNIVEGTYVVDYITHITGLTQEIYKQKVDGKSSFNEQSKQTIKQIINHKIIVGHDLAHDMKMIGLKHQAFIDLVWLLPHHFGLPYKNKLKDLAFEYLGKHIQWGFHDPFEDSLSALQIAQRHIKNGIGTIEVQPYPRQQYNNNPIQIIKAAELDYEKVLMFVLRGSRALGIEIEHAYRSDWDYILVYDTQCKLDGRLIKLPDIDISFFDRQSYQRHMLDNDISYLQAFFLPTSCVHINKIEFPEIQIPKLRASLGFHLNKSRMKIKRFMKSLEQKPQYGWKILKSHHLNLRFMDLFQQLYEYSKRLESELQRRLMEDQKLQHIMSDQSESSSLVRIGQEEKQKGVEESTRQNLLSNINIKRMNQVWFEIEKQYKNSNNLVGMVKKLQKMEAEKYKQINCLYEVSKNVRYKDKQYKQHKRSHNSKAINNKIQLLQQQHFEKLPHSTQLQFKPESQLNTPLQTIAFLRTHVNIEEIEQYRVMFKRHKRYNNLIQFRYMQSANFYHQIPIQCRGLILDSDHNFDIVALPYFKFFDYNDPKYSQVGQLDWDSARVFQKKDGSLAIMYFYNGEWNVASSSVTDGQNNYCFARKQTTVQFKKEFWSIFHSLGYKIPSQADSKKTFIFELMSKNHIIVVKRDKSELQLHGVRDISNLKQEDHIPYGQKYGWKYSTPLQIPIEQLNLESLVKRVEALDPLKCEGYVVCDKNWTRVKIKSSSYVRINWLGELNLGFNKDPKKYIVIEIILSGQAETFCKYCPQWSNIVMEYVGRIKKLNESIAQVYNSLKHLEKKQYAEQIKKYDHDFQSLLFGVKTNPLEYLGNVERVLNPKKFYAYIQRYKHE